MLPIRTAFLFALLGLTLVPASSYAQPLRARSQTGKVAQDNSPAAGKDTAGNSTSSEPGKLNRTKVQIRSSKDGSLQPCYVILPPKFAPNGHEVPLLVALHTWSGNLEQRRTALESGASRRGWIYLFPNFRGPNNTPQGCGSELAQQDIVDAVQWAVEKFPVDRSRIYLTGVSGGGHMTMLMAARHPQIWAAASAWVGISDLKAWHQRHARTRYGDMIRKSCGGTPGASSEVDRQYRLRSPLFHLHNAAGVALDLNAGIHDGHQGSVPIRHTLDAFNAVAKAQRVPTISAREIAELSKPQGRLSSPQKSDQVVDPIFKRKIHLRRRAGPARVTIFEGGHEGIPSAAFAWLERHTKTAPTASPK